jgi:hypothetical protein
LRPLHQNIDKSFVADDEIDPVGFNTSFWPRFVPDVQGLHGAGWIRNERESVLIIGVINYPVWRFTGVKVQGTHVVFRCFLEFREMKFGDELRSGCRRKQVATSKFNPCSWSGFWFGVCD